MRNTVIVTGACVIHGFVPDPLTQEGKADAQAVRDFFTMPDSRRADRHPPRQNGVLFLRR